MYRTLFEVRVIHHYFLDLGTLFFDNLSKEQKALVLKNYNVDDFMQIAPTSECELILRQNKCLLRKTPTGFLIGINCKLSNGKYFPETDMSEIPTFTFSYRFTDPEFMNYTSLPLNTYQTGKIYLQSNLGNGKLFPYLSNAPLPFKNGEKYSAGDLLVNNSVNPTQIYMASEVTNSSPPGNSWINDSLVDGKPVFYVNSNDLADFSGIFLEYPVNQILMSPTVVLVDPQNKEFQPKFENIKGKANSLLRISLNTYPEGLYTLKITDSSVLYSNESSFLLVKEDKKINGVFSLTVRKGVSGIDILKSDGSINSPIYQMRFKNRYTHWRYLGNKFQNVPVTGPHPLTRFGIIPVTVPDNNNQDVDELPNPSVRMIKAEYPNPSESKYNTISEIYVN